MAEIEVLLLLRGTHVPAGTIKARVDDGTPPPFARLRIYRDDQSTTRLALLGWTRDGGGAIYEPAEVPAGAHAEPIAPSEEFQQWQQLQPQRRRTDERPR